MPQPLASSGTLRVGQFSPFLRLFMSRLAVGRLDLATENAVRWLWVDAGQVRAIVSNRDDEKLGTWLVQRGRLDEMSMVLLLLRQPEGVRFGSFLVQEGLLTLEALQAELQALAIRIVSRLLFAPGSYAFTEGDRVALDAATLDMTTATLLVNAVRVLEDLSPLEPLLHTRAYLWGAQDAFSVYQKAALSANEGFVLSHITGASTGEELRRSLSLPKDEMLRALGALVCSGFVVVRERPAETQAPAPRVAPVQPPAAAESLHFTPAQEREHAMVVKVASRIREQHHFDRLQLSPGATQGQVYMRYRELAEVYHPDRAGEPHLRGLERELAEIFRCITEAYDTLGHQETRESYERRKMIGWRPTAAGMGSGIPRDEEEAAPAPAPAAASPSREQLATDSIQRAKELAATGSLSQAVELLDSAVRVKPEPSTLLLLARLELKNPMWAQRALDHLRHAVSIDPRLTEAWLELARLWKARNDVAHQRQCLERILSYDRANREALDGLRSLKTPAP